MATCICGTSVNITCHDPVWKPAICKRPCGYVYICICVYIYIYIYIEVWIFHVGVGLSNVAFARRSKASTVSSHNFHLHNFKFGVSNSRTIAYAHFKLPFESSDLPGAGPIFPDRTFENWPHYVLDMCCSSLITGRSNRLCI